MKHVFIIAGIILAFLWYNSSLQNRNSYQATESDSQESQLSIISQNVKPTGNPGECYVIAEVRNNSDEVVKFASINVTWRDKAGRIIDSGTGTERNIKPHSSKVIDRFFTDIPKGATYSVEVE